MQQVDKIFEEPVYMPEAGKAATPTMRASQAPSLAGVAAVVPVAPSSQKTAPSAPPSMPAHAPFAAMSAQTNLPPSLGYG
jgi:hypothetical protein